MNESLSLIAAVARNGAIGAANALPWRIPSDLKRFKALTMGKALILGRKTFSAIGRPLLGRFCIVISHDPAFAAPGVEIAHDVARAIEAARAHGKDEIFVGGGAEIYAQTIGIADRLHITEVALDPKGDADFPPIAPTEWREIRREMGCRGARDEADFTFVEYERARSSS